jgi:DNA-binding transcriptional MerR regulator
MYTVKTAADHAGVSVPTVYNYAKRFARFFSPTATPEKGTTRLFTVEDIRLLAYLHQKLAQQKLTYEQVEAALAADSRELEQFTAFTSPEAPTSEETTQLVPRAELLAPKLIVEEARTREQQALSHVEALQKEIADLKYKLGVVEGQLQTYKLSFWKRWWGKA